MVLTSPAKQLLYILYTHNYKIYSSRHKKTHLFAHSMVIILKLLIIWFWFFLLLFFILLERYNFYTAILRRGLIYHHLFDDLSLPRYCSEDEFQARMTFRGDILCLAVTIVSNTIKRVSFKKLNIIYCKIIINNT